MKKMAHFSKRKDVNLLVASVLLIAVMVVVSIAVDAWNGKTVHSSQIEELTVSSFAFSSNNTITVVVENNGTVPSGIAEVLINNEKQAFTANSTIIPPKDCIELSIVYTYSNDTNYHFKLVSERGSTYLFTAIAI
jgi:hypothetical protein